MASDGGRVPRAPRLRARASSAAGGGGRSGGRAARVGGGGEGARGFGLGVRRARDRGGAPVRLGGSVLSWPIFYKSHVVIILSFLAVGLGTQLMLLRAPQPRSTVGSLILEAPPAHHAGAEQK